MEVPSRLPRFASALAESVSALIRTPEGSPVGPAIRRLRISVGLLLLIVVLGDHGFHAV